jgi:hypothetical protein
MARQEMDDEKITAIPGKVGFNWYTGPGLKELKVVKKYVDSETL